MSTLIQQKLASLLNAHFDLGKKISEEKDAGYGGSMQEYENVNLYSHAVMEGKAYEVSGLLKTKYLSLGGHGNHPAMHKRLFGFPLSGVHPSIEAGVLMSIFEYGCIYSHSGGIYLTGRIFDYYKALNYDRSWLGLPIADPIITTSYETQYFEFGGLCLDRTSKKMIELHWSTPQLGYPSIVKNTELGSLHMITVTSKETPVDQATAKNLIAGFNNKLFLKETGGSAEIPVEMDTNHIKTYYLETTPKQDVHKFPFMLTSAVFKDNTLYDIKLKLPENEIHTLAPHSIYVNNNPDTCNFAHITDLHLARRYDGYRKKLLDKNLPEKQANKFNNFNDAFRQFIRYANKLHKEGKLDLIICTGDLVDYIFEDAGGEDRFTSRYSNFKFFEQIVRNSVDSPDQQKGEELKVPIFTSLGNHDYRIQSYYLDTTVDLTIFDYEQKQWSSANLIHEEAKILGATISSDRGLAAIIPDIENKNHYLNYYFKHINRKENYEINIGDNKIIMLNGKWDSDYIKNKADAIALKLHNTSNIELKQFFTGSPNSIGFDDGQIEFLKKAISTTAGSVIIGVHNPVVNAIDSSYAYHLRESVRKNASRSFDGEMKKFLYRKRGNYIAPPVGQTGYISFDHLLDLHKGWSIGRTAHFATGDGDDLLDFAIMRGNKKKFLKICAGVDSTKPVNLVLSGHTHTNWECRITYNKATDDFNFFADFYTDNPSNYYYGVDVNIDPNKDLALPGATETKYEVEVGSMSEVVDVDAKIKKRDDGTFVLRTIPNGEALNLVGNKAQWWKMYSPLLIQTEALGPMNSQRGEGPHNPDFRGCRIVSLKESTITGVDYVTKDNINKAVG